MATSDAGTKDGAHRLHTVGDETFPSDISDVGVVFLHEDRGERRPPAFEGSTPPQDTGIAMEPDEAKSLRASRPDEPTCYRSPKQ